MTAFLKLLEIEGSQSLPWIAFLIVGLSAVLGILKLTQKITKTAVSPENTFLWISLKRIMERFLIIPVKPATDSGGCLPPKCS